MCIGHSPTETSTSSGVAVLQQPRPFVKGNGFVLVGVGMLTCFFSQFYKYIWLVKRGVDLGSKPAGFFTHNSITTPVVSALHLYNL